MRIGLLGGSFNPPHLGHIHISLQTQKKFRLQQIWWVPTKQNPLKTAFKSSIVSRILECNKITKNYSQILVKDFENKIPSIYTIDLLERITKQHPQHQFYWIIGADNILQFHKWKNWRKIIALMPLIICDRDDYFYKAIKSKAFLYAKKLNRATFLKIKKSPESSTKIRAKNES